MTGHDPRRVKLRALLSRSNAVSLMSDTKWKKVVELLLTWKRRVRIKLISDSAVSQWGSIVAGIPDTYIELPSVGPILTLEVEWLEIDPATPTYGASVHAITMGEIVAALEALNAMVTIEDGAIRVWGHRIC
jgi:hypothetical protein